MMIKRITLLMLLLPLVLHATSIKRPAEMRLEVRAAQSLFEPFAEDETIALSVRSAVSGYLTIYQIHPDSGLAVLYPQPQHRWLQVEAKKEYRLTEFAADLELKYRNLEGHVYIGMILTPEPTHLVPWIEQAFAEKDIRIGKKIAVTYTDELENLIEKVEADVRFRLGESQPCGFALIPLLLMPRIQILTEVRRDAPRPLRYYYAGKYHLIAPELPESFSRSARRFPLPFTPRYSSPGASSAAPSLLKERPNNSNPPRRQQKQ